MRISLVLIFIVGLGHFIGCQAQKTNRSSFTKADTLRGTLNENRTWWNVKRYDLEVEPFYETKSLKGRNTIKFSGNSGRTMQIDLQTPLVIDSVLFAGKPLPFSRDGNIALIQFPEWFTKQTKQDYFISIFYHGIPREAVRAPWDGGWVWSKDTKGRPWMTVACQGLGASVWYPCKDHQSDEPDEGASLTIVTDHELMGVGNGKHISTIERGGKSVHRWEVRNPINSYNIVPYIGYYENFEEVFSGEEGKLNCNYWVLDYNLGKAKIHFKQVPEMLTCFEHWMGPYPFYEDGYKLVEAPHLGMEHQSNIAYGNKYFNGYLGRDLSGSGWGNQWDFIIIHESGHEWFGNNITTKDIADMWVHEGFTNYSETLFTECKSGTEAANAYLQGSRRNIQNDIPIIGEYGVNKSGSGDMYYKGASLIHTIRTMMQDDEKFRSILRGLNATFYHQTVTTQQIENYLIEHAGLGTKLQTVFDQYLRTTQIPALQYFKKDNKLHARLTNCMPGLTMKIYLPENETSGQWIAMEANQPISISTTLSDMQIGEHLNKNLYLQYTLLQKARWQ